MPKTSKGQAPETFEAEGFEGHYDKLEGWTIGFERYTAEADLSDLFKGLPDDACQCNHLGVVLSGKLVFTYRDGTEDECVDVGRGSRCDELRRACTIPIRDRKVRTIPWHVNREFAPDLFEGMAKVVESWSDAMRVAVLSARLAHLWSWGRITSQTGGEQDFAATHRLRALDSDRDPREEW